MMLFAHDSERRVADLLDEHGIRWEYEPTLFLLEYTTPAGAVKHIGFRPDFYLPEWQLYVEVTEQRSPTRKNRKLRLMGEQYPQVRIELLRRKELAELLSEGTGLPAPPVRRSAESRRPRRR